MTMSAPLYSVTVRRAFIAQHFLVGGDWGRENEVNSHRCSADHLLDRR
jgi:6-pyruvoyltetrahydropterin/6-carboxytetrahydropterin synthase